MQLTDYQFWLNVAKTYSRKMNEAEDLLQDCLLIAVQSAKIDLSIEENRKWFSGVIKNRALMDARSSVRRKNREEKANTTPEFESTETEYHPNQVIIESFPKSAQKVIKLLLAGLNQVEICQILSISTSAFRQRLTTIRKSIKKLPDDLQSEAIALAYYKRENTHEDLAIGLIRRALIRHLRKKEDIGSHDPDGHLIIFRKD